MSGIIFLRTRDIAVIRDFYINEVGMSLWLDQGGCIILRHGNFLLGFCDGENAETEGCITFFYETESEVDTMHTRFQDTALDRPRVNERYNIYNFFARDPEGRTIEFQKFLNDIEPL